MLGDILLLWSHVWSPFVQTKDFYENRMACICPKIKDFLDTNEMCGEDDKLMIVGDRVATLEEGGSCGG